MSESTSPKTPKAPKTPARKTAKPKAAKAKSETAKPKTARPKSAKPANGKPPAAAAPETPGRLVFEDEVGWIHLDEPGKSVNTLSSRFFGWFEEVLEQVSTLPLRGLVFVSDKPGCFIAGADITELQAFSDPAEVEAMIRRGHALVGRFAKLRFPVVAAIDGVCLGGGLELSLACDFRVATDAPHTKLGLPEVLLGLFPGLGGTQRLPRLIGVQDALDMILTGKQVDGRKAQRLGLVDDLCHPSALRDAALRALAWGKPGRPGYRGPRAKAKLDLGRRVTDFLGRTPGVNAIVYDQAKGTVLKKTGGHYPAPLAAIGVVREGLRMPLAEALELEAAAFAQIVVTDVAKNLISIFFTKNAVEGRAKKLAAKSRPVERVGVLGAGFMGSGIAQVLAHKGYEVVLKDRDHEALGRGLKQCDDLFAALVKRRKYRPVERKLAMSRIVPEVRYEGFHGLPIVIEAVFEDLKVKHRVIREVEATASEDLIFASNTSTIPIARLAEASRRPENVIGMHFFSPVHKMPLLEIIRHPKTSDEALATTVEVGRKMGKTIIVVNDGPGFFTSRVLGPFVNEALWCLDQGASIEQIDKALTDWGFPVGPLALLDEVGIDIAHHAGSVMAEAAGERAQPSPVFARMIEVERFGRKAKRGFYDYTTKPKRVDRTVYELLEWQPAEVASDEIVERCWMQMLNETAMCMAEGVITDPKDVDIGVIFGFGFPPFRGGILREADRLGLGFVVDQLEGYADKHGPRLKPAALLVEMAKKGRKFHQD